MSKSTIKLTSVNNYKKSSEITSDAGVKLKIGRDIFVYEADGSEDAIKAFKKSITDAGREVQYSDNKKPLFWSTKVLGDTAEMEQSVKTGSFYVVEPLDIVSLRNMCETHKNDPILSRVFAERYADAYTAQFTLSRKRNVSSVKAEDAVVETAKADL